MTHRLLSLAHTYLGIPRDHPVATDLPVGNTEDHPPVITEDRRHRASTEDPLPASMAGHPRDSMAVAPLKVTPVTNSPKAVVTLAPDIVGKVGELSRVRPKLVDGCYKNGRSGFGGIYMKAM